MCRKEQAMERIKAKREQTMVKCGAFLAVAALVAALLSPLQLNNPYLRSSSFEKITVKRYESVWDIASRYSRDDSQARILTQAIIEINGLPHDAEIKTGQELQIPLLKPVDDGLVRMAEK